MRPSAKVPRLACVNRDRAGFGSIAEWHLDFGKALRHIAFELLAWFRQPREMIATTFFRSWFEAIGTIGHLVSGYGLEKVPVQCLKLSSIVTPLKLDERLKSFQRLHGALETYRARQEVMGRSSLGSERADQIVSKDMCPNLLSH